MALVVSVFLGILSFNDGDEECLSFAVGFAALVGAAAVVAGVPGIDAAHFALIVVVFAVVPGVGFGAIFDC